MNMNAKTKIAGLIMIAGFLLASMALPALAGGDHGKPGQKDIVETAVAAGNFTTLAKALEAAGLIETLKSAGPFTVFAPTDEAFTKLPAGTLEGLLNDPAKLKSILLYHVVSGKVMAENVMKLKSAKTVEGSSVKISVQGGKALINDANVIRADVMASNGVIHVIDSVILPH